MRTTGENLKKRSGVYCIIHRDSGMVYVGSTKDFWKRYTEHLGAVRRNQRQSMLYRMLREFGIGAFDFSVIEDCDISVMVVREEFYISLMDAASVRGMNTITKPTAVVFGRPVSEITRQRKSLATKGRKQTPEVCERKRLAHQAMSPEMKARVAATQINNKGRKMSDEQREKLRIAKTGKPLSAEHRAKIGAAGIGRKVSDECRKKRSAALKGRKFSADVRARMREGVKKRPPISEETRALIAENSREMWRKKAISRESKQMRLF